MRLHLIISMTMFCLISRERVSSCWSIWLSMGSCDTDSMRLMVGSVCGFDW